MPDRIDAVWMWISTDETGEGVLGAPLLGPGTLLPLIAADEARLTSIRPWAQKIAEAKGIKVKLIKLTTREEIEEIDHIN